MLLMGGERGGRRRRRSKRLAGTPSGQGCWGEEVLCEVIGAKGAGGGRKEATRGWWRSSEGVSFSLDYRQL